MEGQRELAGDIGTRGGGELEWEGEGQGEGEEGGLDWELRLSSRGVENGLRVSKALESRCPRYVKKLREVRGGGGMEANPWVWSCTIVEAVEGIKGGGGGWCSKIDNGGGGGGGLDYGEYQPLGHTRGNAGGGGGGGEWGRET